MRLISKYSGCEISGELQNNVKIMVLGPQLVQIRTKLEATIKLNQVDNSKRFW